MSLCLYAANHSSQTPLGSSRLLRLPPAPLLHLLCISSTSFHPGSPAASSPHALIFFCLRLKRMLQPKPSQQVQTTCFLNYFDWYFLIELCRYAVNLDATTPLCCQLRRSYAAVLPFLWSYAAMPPICTLPLPLSMLPCLYASLQPATRTTLLCNIVHPPPSGKRPFQHHCMHSRPVATIGATCVFSHIVPCPLLHHLHLKFVQGDWEEYSQWTDGLGLVG